MIRIEAKYTRNGGKFFVPSSDYSGLKSAERQAVFRIRQRIDGASKPAARANANGGSGVSSNEHNKLKRSVAALSKQVKESSLCSNDENLFSDNNEDDDAKEVRKKNKGNPALGKQGRKKGG